MLQKFEAKNYALRKSKDGIIVSFVIHANDVTPELLSLPVGARVVIGIVPIMDDETLDTENPAASHVAEANIPVPPRPSLEPPRETAQKAHRKFADMPFSQQAHLRCKDSNFVLFLQERTRKAMGYDGAATYVRDYCGVKSRSELDGEPVPAERWQTLNAEFETWQFSRRYEDVAR